MFSEVIAEEQHNVWYGYLASPSGSVFLQDLSVSECEAR